MRNWPMVLLPDLREPCDGASCRLAMASRSGCQRQEVVQAKGEVDRSPAGSQDSEDVGRRWVRHVNVWLESVARETTSVVKTVKAAAGQATRRRAQRGHFESESPQSVCGSVRVYRGAKGPDRLGGRYPIGWTGRQTTSLGIACMDVSRGGKPGRSGAVTSTGKGRKEES